jgi:hypothetical protein
MTTDQKRLIYTAVNKTYTLTVFSNQNTLEKRHEIRKQIIFADESLTKEEKSEAIKLLNKEIDYFKVVYNYGTKRICKSCKEEYLATLYCEHCIRNYLKANFQSWTSGNNDIDNLIKKCQMEASAPDVIVEWIPYDNFQNIKYLTKGGFSEIYTADWTNGFYEVWDNKENQLKRLGMRAVALKTLENVESANRSWFEEVYNLISIYLIVIFFGKKIFI